MGGRGDDEISRTPVSDRQSTQTFTNVTLHMHTHAVLPWGVDAICSAATGALTTLCVVVCICDPSLPLVRWPRDKSECFGGMNECASEWVTDLCVWLYTIGLPP